MYHQPKRARTAQSGACSHCVRQRERCYIGVKGVPCSTCRRLKLTCDAKADIEVQGKRFRPPLIFCAAEVFASHMRRAELEQPFRKSPNPAISATDPLENYISIADQLLGPEPSNSLQPPDPPQPPERSIAALYPDYNLTLPSRLNRKSLEFLDDNDKPCLPSPAFRTELLKSYIFWVHPQVPVLDLESFLGAIGGQNDGEDVNLLLFYAVMLAASTFVDLTHIHREGYTSRNAIRDILYQRVKTLLDLDCREDRLATVQALLLLVHWNDVPDEEKDTTHWTGICMSLAVSIGLHRNLDSTMLSPARRKSWSRTFWSLYNHIRVTTIKYDDSIWDRPEIGMVTLSDFQLSVFSPEAQAVAGHCDVLHTIEAQKTQAIVFIEKTRLCRLTRFSRISDKVSQLIVGTNCPGVWAPSPNQRARADEIENLQVWESQLPSAARHNYPLALIPNDWERSIYLHRIWLRLLCLGPAYATACGEHSTVEEVPIIPPLWSPYGEADRHLAKLTDLFDEVDSLGLTEQLPWPSTALLILVLAYHHRPVDTGTPAAQNASARILHKAWNMMHKIEATSALARRTIAQTDNDACTDLWERLSSTLLPS